MAPAAVKKMTLNAALQVLMKAASRDVSGAGLGMRSTTDEWRKEVALAWAVAHRRVYGWEPADNEYRNAGMTPPRDA